MVAFEVNRRAYIHLASMEQVLNAITSLFSSSLHVEEPTLAYANSGLPSLHLLGMSLKPLAFNTASFALHPIISEAT
jgi:hypothetical protein